MSILMKVYNKGTRPIVWSRTRKGVHAIHPGKFDVFGKEHAEAIIKKFPDAVSEADHKKILADRKVKAKEASEKVKREADKK